VEVKRLSALEELLNYELPKHLIAQELSDPRDACRLLVVHRDTGTLEDKRFYQIKDYVKPGDVLVLNNTKVLKARIKGRRKTGGAVEILLVRPLRDNVWECLLKPLRKIKIGEVLLLNGGAEVKLLERTERTAIIELGMSAQELDSYLDDWERYRLLLI